jgi:hypothetical protein
VERALRIRRNVFLIAFGIVVALVAASSVTAPSPERASRPDALTVAFAIIALIDVAVWWGVVLRPDNVRGLAARQSEAMGLERMAWVLSIMGVGGATVPALGGVILFQLSGQLWRLAVLLGIAVLGGVLLWFRVGEDIRQLTEGGMTAWDPFAGPGR